jgi:hypothetical protein
VSSGIGDTNEMRRRLEQARMAAQRGGIGLDATAAEPPQLAETQGGLDTIGNAIAGLPGKFQRELPMFMAGLRSLYQDPTRIADTPTAQSIKQAITLPREVVEGKVDPRSDEGIGRAFDMAGWATGGSSFGSAPEGALAAGAPRRTPQDALLRKLKQEYQSEAPRTDPDKWTYKLAEGPQPQLDPVKDFDINQVKEGDAFIPLVGDKSRVSAPLAQVGPYKFSEPVTMEGGSDFTRGNAAWASNSTIPQTILNKADRVAQAGGRPIGVTVGMGSQGINYSHHAYEPMIRMMQSSKVKAADVKDFDKQFRQDYPDWPGLKNEDAAIDFLRKQDTTARNPFVALHQSGAFQEKGFPEGGPIRWAATEPDLRQVLDPLTGKPIRGPAGYNFVEMDPSKEVSPSSHRSYATDVPKKEYLGRAPLVPYETMFRDWAASPRATRFGPSQTSHKGYTFGKDAPIQVIDQQLIDELGRLYEARKRGR